MNEPDKTANMISLPQDGYVDGSTPFSPIEMESCKSSLIFELIDKIKTPAKASTESLLTYFKGVNMEYNQ